MYYVSRQHSWPDGDYLVEIESGGADYASPGMLVCKYAGEGEEYLSAVDAANAALAIATMWQTDCPDKEIHLGWGTTGGGLCAIVGETIDPELKQELLAWAEKRDEKAPKCDQCGEIMGKEKWENANSSWSGLTFCSEYCAERAQEFDDEEDEKWQEEEGNHDHV